MIMHEAAIQLIDGQIAFLRETEKWLNTVQEADRVKRLDQVRALIAEYQKTNERLKHDVDI